MNAAPRRRQARAARGEVEAVIDASGGRWSRRLSLWLDALLIIEERV